MAGWTPAPAHLTLLLTLVAVLLAALPALAQASPDGDDDPTYNAGSAFGTQYSPLDHREQLVPLRRQAGHRPGTGRLERDGVLMFERGEGRWVLPAADPLRLQRPAHRLHEPGRHQRPVPGRRRSTTPSSWTSASWPTARSWFCCAAAARRRAAGERLGPPRYDADGEELDSAVRRAPGPCEVRRNGGSRIAVPEVRGFVDAARVNADGAVSALWDCIHGRGIRRQVYDRAFADDGTMACSSPSTRRATTSRPTPSEIRAATTARTWSWDRTAILRAGRRPIPPTLIERFGENGTSQVFHVN